MLRENEHLTYPRKLNPISISKNTLVKKEMKCKYSPNLKAKYDCARTLRSVSELLVDVFIVVSGNTVTSSMFKVK